MIRQNELAAIEPLEPRALRSSTTPSDTLAVNATNDSDVITVNVRAGTSGDKVLRVTINGDVRNYSLNGIEHINVNSLNGDDQVFIDKSVVRSIYVNGGLGDDSLNGGSGNDTLQGGRGNDILTGNAGNDHLLGYSGEDSLNGGDGKDRLEGGDGNDTLFGGTGADTLTGNAGNDQMFGQSGDDVFYSKDNEADTLVGGDGFNRAQRDTSVLDIATGIKEDLA